MKNGTKKMKDIQKRPKRNDRNSKLRKERKINYDNAIEIDRNDGEKYIWIFGNAVQDITIEADLNTLSRQDSNISDYIRLEEQGLVVRKGIIIRTRSGSQRFFIEIEMDAEEKPKRGFYLLTPGSKHNLVNSISDNSSYNTDQQTRSYFVPCEDITWGGGGVNNVTFIRAICPNYQLVPVMYSDIAMSMSLPKLTIEFERIQNYLSQQTKLKTFEKSKTKRPSGFARLLEELYKIDPKTSEEITCGIAKKAAEHSPNRSLEVYLASISAKCIFYRLSELQPRRNLVLSQIRSAKRVIDNKIICRGKTLDLPDSEERKITGLFNKYRKKVGAVCINSLKDGALFRSAYLMLKRNIKSDLHFVGIMAMTEPMQKYTKWLLKDRGRYNRFPPFILVFNEREVYSFAEKFDKSINKFVIGDDDPPNMCEFGRIGIVLRKQFGPTIPRIYITLGPRGSLGIDQFGNVVYVSSFTKPGKTVFDTNACGDAYCASITLLEWASRHGFPRISQMDPQESPPPNVETLEMRYFMAIATALSYCKATNRRGRIYASEVNDLLEHIHLASAILPPIDLLVNGKQFSVYIDQNCRLKTPEQATLFKVTPDLAKLMSDEDEL